MIQEKIIPIINNIGVGLIDFPSVELYRLTLPPTTGIFNRLQLVAMLSIVYEKSFIESFGCPKFKQFHYIMDSHH